MLGLQDVLGLQGVLDLQDMLGLQGVLSLQGVVGLQDGLDLQRHYCPDGCKVLQQLNIAPSQPPGHRLPGMGKVISGEMKIFRTQLNKGT